MSIIDHILRRVFFPKRDHKHAPDDDTLCHREAQNLIPGSERSSYALELDTRAWLREFKSKSIVPWLAFIISIISITVSICSFVVATKQPVPQQQQSHSP